MMMYLVAATGSLLVGLSIGWCGIAGFLLPILFMNYFGLEPNAALFVSFFCFALSGAVGARNYALRGELPIEQGLILGISSLLGGVLGALFGQYFTGMHMKTILYFVVLFSGCAILLQEILLKMVETKDIKDGAVKNLYNDSYDLKINQSGIGKILIPRHILVFIGIVTAFLCALSGAGGPVLVMPILVLLGMSVKAAIGTALFDSIFIALPAILVYGAKSDIKSLLTILVVALISHGMGIQLGSRMAGMIPQKPLKRAIAVGSIVFACWKLFW